jgi:hypothetical protein
MIILQLRIVEKFVFFEIVITHGESLLRLRPLLWIQTSLGQYSLQTLTPFDSVVNSNDQSYFKASGISLSASSPWFTKRTLEIEICQH